MTDQPTQLTFYQCETKGCEYFKIPKQIREYATTGKPLYPPAVVCDSLHGCNKEMARMKNTTLSE